MDVKKLVLFIFTVGSLQFTGFSQEKHFPVPTGNDKQLFYLQRTPNTNTIVYELNYKNGSIDRERPVAVFWIRYQEKGQREELSFIQRKFAYGVKAKMISPELYELSIVSYKNRKLYLRQGADKKFYVYTDINQRSAVLTSIFIKINGGSPWSPNIEWVEITGIEPTSQSVVKQRVKI
jgi:hypothetical protein